MNDYFTTVFIFLLLVLIGVAIGAGEYYAEKDKDYVKFRYLPRTAK